MDIRHDWTREEVLGLLTGPLEPLLDRARDVHARYAAQDVQQCQLLSIKTGACPEDCGYCSQSAHFKTSIKPENLMDVDTVVRTAQEAHANGASRFCMGAAWRKAPSDRRFESVLDMIRGVAATGMEVCCTLGMATEDQLRQMKEAGLTAYNHNLDTSREHYSKVISTRTYDDRLETLANARRAGVQVCCGGILGLGETEKDRAAFLVELATMDPHPESVPVNLLVPIEGTPLEGTPAVPFDEFLRSVATARILMPRSRVRLSAGRNTLTEEQQLQCFAAGANSIFVGEKLLTAPNVEWDQDKLMVERLPQNQSPTTQASL
ncbi:biotin synthase BioB [bacterium]|nr:biotin synthase BioB [bacterium]